MFDIDHMANKTIWTWWTGTNQMSEDRWRSLRGLMRKNRLCDVKLITHDIIETLPNLHKGFKFLSEVHKSDYLKCYFMHHLW